MHLVRTVTKLSSKGNDLSNDKLGNTARVAEWRIEDSNSMLRCILRVNLICANAKATDYYQVLGLPEHPSCKLRLRPYADNVDIPLHPSVQHFVPPGILERYLTVSS